jgi:hypothetical protein
MKKKEGGGRQCCGSGSGYRSGSGRIQNFLLDPDPDQDPEEITSDPDPANPGPE